MSELNIYVLRLIVKSVGLLTNYIANEIRRGQVVSQINFHMKASIPALF